MSADIIKFIAAVQIWFMRCEVCSIIDFYGFISEGCEV